MFRFSKLNERSKGRRGRSTVSVIESLESRVLLANLTSSIRGSKFVDVNGNGTQDVGDVAPTTRFTFRATITDESGTRTQDASTFLAGDPQPFPGVVLAPGEFYFPLSIQYTAGNYPYATITIAEVGPSGWLQTTPAIPTLFVVADGQSFTPVGVSELNVGNFQLNTISGTKYNDVNGDGVVGPGDTGLAGWRIFNDRNANDVWDSATEESTLTAADGTYQLTLGPGTYRIREVGQAGWIHTNANPPDFVGASGATWTANFLNTQSSQISGRKFNDINGNGVDNGDPGLAGWTIYIDANNNSNLDAGEASTVTDGTGAYTFSNLLPGTYNIREVQQAGWVQTVGPAPVVVTQGSAITGQSFGNFQLNTVSGKKINDVNGNGNVDPGDNGLAGWRIFNDRNGNNIWDSGTEESAVTAADGSYTLTLGPGTYKIREVGQAGWIHTNANPSDMTGTSGATWTANFLNTLASQIAGRKFNDLNGNGIDNSDPGLSGWTIYLDTNGNSSLDVGEISTVTDASGSYAFANLLPGTYTIREVQQPGWVQTAGPAPVNVTQGSAIGGLNFGNFRLVSVSGLKFQDMTGNGSQDAGDTGLAGWTIFNDANNNGILDIGEQSTVTGADGSYTLANLGPGTIRIREVVSNPWMQTTANPADFAATSGVNQVGYNFGNFQRFSITGIKYNDLNGNGSREAGDPGLIGWTIFNDANNNSLLDAGEASTTTAADGSYSLTNLGPGTYRIRELNQTGWIQTSTNPSDIIGTSGSTFSNTNFGNFQLVSVSGIKFNDVNGDGNPAGDSGLSGWTIYDDANNNGVFDAGELSTVTGVNGVWSFTNLGPRTLRIREVQQVGWVQTTANPGLISTSSGTNVTGINFGNRNPVAPGSISGTKYNDVTGNGVKDSGDSGLSGWTIFLDTNKNGVLDAGEVSTTTDANGNYTFSNLSAGTYTVREVQKGGWTQTSTNPVDQVVNNGDQKTGVNFGNFQLATVSGTKFYDINANGVRDPGELGLSGWTIYLDANNNGAFDAGDSTRVTDASGNYTFTGIGPGTFRFGEVAQFNWIQMTANPVVTTTSGANITSQMFGNIQLSDMVKLGKLSLTGTNLTNYQNGKMAAQAQFIANLYLTYKKPSTLTGMCNYLKLFMAGYSSSFVETKFKQDFNIA